ncbi:MAG TPA: SRPBCC family protein [Candidatus Nanoarchaeia archaeon]|nr:SRPBCC family protein [Candidatus Nanoarchaeia archaeon]
MKTIKQVVTFKAKPSEVYQALMDSKKHAAFTGAPANIKDKVGTKFTAYGDYIEGENLELIKNKKIVQKWRGSEWEKGHYSKVKYELKAVKGGTKLTFTQTEVPDKEYKHINQGWKEQYWNKMKEVFNW